MKLTRRIIAYVFMTLFGVGLTALSVWGQIDSFWAGMGTALIVVAVLRLVQNIRLARDADYREAVQTEIHDERNSFLRCKAWAWAGYLFIIISAVAVIVLRVLGQLLLSQTVCYGMCLLLVLYWGAYLVLRKKY